MNESAARRVPLMRSDDWRILFLLILFSPLWIPVALIGGVWFGIISIFSRLRLPDMIGGPLGIVWLALMIPFYPVLMLTSVAFGQLLRERMAVDDSAITVRGLIKTRQIPWHEIAQIVEVFSPPTNTFKLIFSNGDELAFSAFAEIQPVLHAAPGHGVTVLRLPKPARGMPCNDSAQDW